MGNSELHHIRSPLITQRASRLSPLSRQESDHGMEVIRGEPQHFIVFIGVHPPQQFQSSFQRSRPDYPPWYEKDSADQIHPRIRGTVRSDAPANLLHEPTIGSICGF